MNYPNVLTGDLLMRAKWLNFVNHTGVAISPNRVLHNTPEKGEHVSTLEEFSQGKQVEVQRTGADPLAVSQRAQKVLANPQKYDPISRNCEHTANEVAQGRAKSPQAIFWIFGVALFLIWFFRRN